MAKYKLTGYLDAWVTSPEGNSYRPTKVLYAKYDWTCKLKELYLRFFYDWVTVELAGLAEEED